MSKKSFLSAVAAGTAGTAVGLWICGQIVPLRGTVRVECSIRIGRPAAEVYSGFAQVERMPQFTQSVVSVDTRGDISVWIARIAGHRYKWDVEIVQVVPKQMIGWKSYLGPKHCGRISFLSLGEETLVHVEMNYVPATNLARLVDGTPSVKLGGVLEAALRDIKVTLESEARDEAPRKQDTGT
jgi:uncharacterized membrane protein